MTNQKFDAILEGLKALLETHPDEAAVEALYNNMLSFSVQPGMNRELAKTELLRGLWNTTQEALDVNLNGGA